MSVAGAVLMGLCRARTNKALTSLSITVFGLVPDRGRVTDHQQADNYFIK